MIYGFENITYSLTDYERQNILPKVVNLLSEAKGIDNAIPSHQIINYVNQYLPDEKGKRLTSPRLRKMINVIRRKGMINNLIASSKGYYQTDSIETLSRYCHSLKERASAILTVRNSLRVDLKNLMQNPITPNLKNSTNDTKRLSHP